LRDIFSGAATDEESNSETFSGAITDAAARRETFSGETAIEELLFKPA
jgi:hypothetical protein